MDPSIGLRNASLAAVKTQLDGGFIMLFSGPVPASPDDAIDGSSVLLAQIYGDGASAGCTFQAPAAGVLPKTAAEAWAGPVLANGTVTFARFVAATGDDGTGATTTLPRLQQTVGTAGAELTLSAVILSTGGDPVKVGGFEVRQG